MNDVGIDIVGPTHAGRNNSLHNYKLLCAEYDTLLKRVLFLPQANGLIDEELSQTSKHLFRKYKRIMEKKNMNVTEKLLILLKKINKIHTQLLALPEHKRDFGEYNSLCEKFENFLETVISDFIDFDNIKKTVQEEIENVIKTKMAGIFDKKYDMIISEKMKTIDKDIQDKLSEKLIDMIDSEEFLKKFQQYKPDLYELIKNRPKEFRPVYKNEKRKKAKKEKNYAE